VPARWRRERYQKSKKNKKKAPKINKFMRKPRNMSRWEFLKSKLFTLYFAFPFRKRKRKRRHRIFRTLKWLFKLHKINKIKFTYSRFPRKTLLKKKIVLKKVLYYYYNLPVRKKFSEIKKYSNKVLNKISINSNKNLINILESKLCVFLTRLKYASTIWLSKKLITRGKILVNGSLVYKPSYILRQGDIVQLHPDAMTEFYYYYIVREASRSTKRWTNRKIYYKFLNSMNKIRNFRKSKRIYKRYLYRAKGYKVVPFRFRYIQEKKRYFFMYPFRYLYWKQKNHMSSFAGANLI
jgi:ribosomal protein S4